MNLARNALAWAAQNGWLREQAPRYGFVRRSVRRFIPGENVEDALSAAQILARDGIASLVTRLGENVSDRAEAEAVTRHYLGVLERIRAADLPVEISVKLTQMGIDLVDDRDIDPGGHRGKDFCFANLLKLVSHASFSSPSSEAEAQKRIWIDMEGSPYVDATLDLHRRVRNQSPNVGVCVQAYLYRTEKDLESLISMGASVRLVKGAYHEPSEIAFPKKSDVDENYFRLARMLLSLEARASGVRAALATHDRNLIARIAGWAQEQGIPKNKIQFAMLYGIQRAEQLRLAREGYGSCVLVSYGSYWYPWFVRRLAERPANILFMARNLFSG